MMNKQIFGLMFSFIFFIGCSTTRFSFNSKKASEYISVHPELSVNIRNALAGGIVVAGMSREQVILCWGKPSAKKIEYIGGACEENWSYFKRRDKTKTDDGSSYWHMDIPNKRVTFANGLAIHWREYTDEITVEQNTEQSQSVPSAKVSQKGTVKPEVIKPSVYSPRAKPSFSTWPHLTINGVVVKGNHGSAMINRTLLDQGDIIEDVKLISVNEDGVLLEYNNATQFLSKGHSTWE